MSGLQLIYDKSRTDRISVALPSSKSMAARALIIAALAGVRPEDIQTLHVCTDT